MPCCIPRSLSVFLFLVPGSHGRMPHSHPMTTQTEPAPGPSPEASTHHEVSRLIRPLAVLAVVAIILARAVTPALKGTFSGIDGLIRWADIAAGLLSQGLAFALTALAIGALLVVGRDRRVSIVARALLVPQTVLVLFFGIWATRNTVGNPGVMLLGMLAVSVSTLGAVEGLRQARTRALGVVLGLTSMAGFTHLLAAVVAWRTPDSARLAAAMGSLSLVIHAAALLVALVWLASRRRSVLPPATMISLVVSVLLTWAASRGSLMSAAPGWVFAARAMDRLTPSPAPSLPASFAIFLSALAPALAVGALATRRQIPTIIGSLALALTAGVMVDAPLQAMMLITASLGTVLASRDDRGMWEALLGRPLKT